MSSPHDIDLSDQKVYEQIESSLILDLSQSSKKGLIGINDLDAEYPHRFYRQLFNNHGSFGKKLKRRFFYISKKRIETPEKFQVHVSSATRRLSISSPVPSSMSGVLGMLSGKTPDPQVSSISAVKKKLDLPTKKENFVESPSASK